jgi:cbb3-type cytochrome oxidase subunit 3
LLVIFCAIVAWAYMPQRRAQMDESARIPLRDDR